MDLQCSGSGYDHTVHSPREQNLPHPATETSREEARVLYYGMKTDKFSPDSDTLQLSPHLQPSREENAKELSTRKRKISDHQYQSAFTLNTNDKKQTLADSTPEISASASHPGARASEMDSTWAPDKTQPDVQAADNIYDQQIQRVWKILGDVPSTTKISSTPTHHSVIRDMSPNTNIEGTGFPFYSDIARAEEQIERLRILLEGSTASLPGLASVKSDYRADQTQSTLFKDLPTPFTPEPLATPWDLSRTTDEKQLTADSYPPPLNTGLTDESTTTETQQLTTEQTATSSSSSTEVQTDDTDKVHAEHRRQASTATESSSNTGLSATGTGSSAESEFRPKNEDDIKQISESMKKETASYKTIPTTIRVVSVAKPHLTPAKPPESPGTNQSASFQSNIVPTTKKKSVRWATSVEPNRSSSVQVHKETQKQQEESLTTETASTSGPAVSVIGAKKATAGGMPFGII